MHKFFTNRKREIVKRKELKDEHKKAFLSKKERKKLFLTFAEIRTAEIRLLKYLQDQMFNNIKNKEQLSSFTSPSYSRRDNFQVGGRRFCRSTNFARWREEMDLYLYLCRVSGGTFWVSNYRYPRKIL